MENSIKLKVFAKINLSLNICGMHNSDSGLHTLETVMASVSVADVITVSLRDDDKINVEFSCPDIDKNNNTVIKAVNKIREFKSDFGVDIFVEKHIPIGSGLGGSSVDAAGVIYALDNLLNLTKDGFKPSLAGSSVGSDVPFLLKGGFACVKGVGNECYFFEPKVELYMVIARGKSPVSTAQSYAKFDEFYDSKIYEPTDTITLIKKLASKDLKGAASYMDNALFLPSSALNFEIETTLNELKKHGAYKTLMTGSGSACFGLFDSFEKAKHAQRALKPKLDFVLAAKTQSQGIEIL